MLRLPSWSNPLFAFGIFTLVACGERGAPSGAAATAEAPPSAVPTSSAAVVAPSSSAEEKPPALPKGPKYFVRARTNRYSRMSWVGSGVVVCPSSDCLGDAELFTEKGLTDTYDPRGAIELQFGYMFKKKLNEQRISYSGDYPDICASFSYWNDRSDFSGVTVKRTGKTWAGGYCQHASVEEPKIPRPPRALDDALLHAPIPKAEKKILHGAGAPPMLIAEQALYLWDGKAWKKSEAPWKISTEEPQATELPISRVAVRLTNGHTFVPEGGYLVDSKGAISTFDLIHEDKPLSSNVGIDGVIWAKKGPWLIGREKDDLVFLSADPAEKTRLARAPIPAREGTKPASAPPSKSSAAAPLPPAPSAAQSASPAVSAPAASSAAASASSGIPAVSPPVASASASASAGASATAMAAPAQGTADAAASAAPSADPAATSTASAGATDSAPSGMAPPKVFSSSCATPFVLLATPPSPGQAYATTRDGLRGNGDLQDVVTFVEVVIEGKVYFGVQVKTEAEARAFISLVERSVKGMKPQLTCLDVLSQIPDRYSPPPGMRIVGINLTTGELVPFD